MPNGHQRYFCPLCKQTFVETFDSIYYYKHISPEKIKEVLQTHSEGSSLRGISRITRLAYNTVVNIVRAASNKAQLVHNAQVEQVETEEVSADTSTSSVQVRCGLLCKKTEVVTELCRSAMLARRTRKGRLLDSYQLGK
jgi:lambda repressor-like predicted transcriptional regulator